MKIHLEGGTDVAQLAIFNPVRIPADYMMRISKNPEALNSELAAAHTATFLTTGADGAYLLHLFLNEPVPDGLSKFCEDAIEVDKFDLSEGKIAFGGAESLGPDFKPNNAIRSDADVPAGIYKLSMWRTEYPDNHVEKLVGKSMNAAERRVHDLPGTIILFGIALTIAAAIVLTFLGLSAWWSLISVPLTIVALMGLTKTSAYKSAQEKARSVENNFPSIVAWMGQE